MAKGAPAAAAANTDSIFELAELGFTSWFKKEKNRFLPICPELAAKEVVQAYYVNVLKPPVICIKREFSKTEFTDASKMYAIYSIYDRRIKLFESGTLEEIQAFCTEHRLPLQEFVEEFKLLESTTKVLNRDNPLEAIAAAVGE